jgi:cob(I)alamin adenosyltransferase
MAPQDWSSGDRRPKYDLRIAAYGTVDETNAAIGTARLHTADHAGSGCDADADPE